MKNLVLTDGEIDKKVTYGFDFVYIFSFVFIMILPFYFIYKKEYKVFFTSMILMFIILPILMLLFTMIHPLGYYFSIAVYTVFLLYNFYIVPKNMAKWKIKKLYKCGFTTIKANDKKDLDYFECAISDTSFLANSFS